MLTLSSVSLNHGNRPCVTELSFEIQKGSCCVITGKNASGKTTLMDALMGLHRPESGQILIDGHDLYQLQKSGKKAFFSKTGLVQQQVHLRPLDTVRKALDHEMADSIQRERMIKFVGLEQRANGLVKELSFSEQRRLDLARSLVHQPKLVIWDEPFIGLDDDWKARFVQALRELQDLGTSTIVATTSPAIFASLKDFHSLVLR